MIVEQLDTPVDVPVEHSPTGTVTATHASYGQGHTPYFPTPQARSFRVLGFLREGKFVLLPDSEDTVLLEDTKAHADYSACLDADGFLSEKLVITQHKAVRAREAEQAAQTDAANTEASDAVDASKV